MIGKTSQGIKAAINEHHFISSVIKGLIVSYLVNIPAFIVFAFVLSYTDFPVKHISTVVLITTIISVLIAGSTATKTAKKKGWLNGAATGLVYMVILYLASSIVYSNFAITRPVITMTVIGVLTGGLGGILGINLGTGHSKSKR